MSQTVIFQAGQKLDQLTKQRMNSRGLKYAEAFKEVCDENPTLVHEYNYGQQVMTKKYAELTPIEQEMARCQADPDYVRRKASIVVDQYAQKLMTRWGQHRTLDRDSYRAAVEEIRRLNLRLAAAE